MFKKRVREKKKTPHLEDQENLLSFPQNISNSIRTRFEDEVRVATFEDENWDLIEQLQDLGVSIHFEGEGKYLEPLFALPDEPTRAIIKKATANLVALRIRWTASHGVNRHDLKREFLVNLLQRHRSVPVGSPLHESLSKICRWLLGQVQDRLYEHLGEERFAKRRLSYSYGLSEAKRILSYFQNPKKPKGERSPEQWCEQGLDNLRGGDQAFPDGQEQPITEKKLERRLRLLKERKSILR